MHQASKHKSSLSTQIDEQLWQALKEGDQQAYAKIYNNHINKLYSYGKKLCSNTVLVEDAIQDVFIELWKYKSNLGPIRSIHAYLCSCLRRHLLKTLKKDRIFVLNGQHLNEDNFEFELSVQELLVRDQEKQAEVQKIKKALELLTKRQKEVIYLRYFQDLNYQEIADMMGLNQRSTYNLVSKAIYLLKDKLIILIIYFLIFK